MCFQACANFCIFGDSPYHSKDSDCVKTLPHYRPAPVPGPCASFCDEHKLARYISRSEMFSFWKRDCIAGWDAISAIKLIGENISRYTQRYVNNRRSNRLLNFDQNRTSTKSNVNMIVDFLTFDFLMVDFYVHILMFDFVWCSIFWWSIVSMLDLLMFQKTKHQKVERQQQSNVTNWTSKNRTRTSKSARQQIDERFFFLCSRCVSRLIREMCLAVSYCYMRAQLFPRARNPERNSTKFSGASRHKRHCMAGCHASDLRGWLLRCARQSPSRICMAGCPA